LRTLLGRSLRALYEPSSPARVGCDQHSNRTTKYVYQNKMQSFLDQPGRQVRPGPCLSSRWRARRTGRSGDPDRLRQRHGSVAGHLPRRHLHRAAVPPQGRRKGACRRCGCIGKREWLQRARVGRAAREPCQPRDSSRISIRGDGTRGVF